MKVMTSLLSLRLAILFRRVGAAEGSIGRILKGALNEDIRALPFWHLKKIERILSIVYFACIMNIETYH